MLDKDKKTLIISFLGLLVLLLVIYSFGGGTTGEIVKDVSPKLTEIRLSSQDYLAAEEKPVINAGGPVYIMVESGSAGTRIKYDIFKGPSSKGRVITYSKLLSKCDPELRGTYATENICQANKPCCSTFYTEEDWTGDYCLRVFDVQFKKYVEKCFTIE